MLKVIVASKNPVKLEATKIGFEKIFPDKHFEFQGVSVASEVSDQPMTDEETLQGALNRVKNAKKEFSDADFWVGMEGGLEKRDDELNAFAWVVISSGNLIKKSRTGTFPLPRKISNLIEQGIELGEADDIVFSHSNSKQKNGAVGILSGNLITRTSYYSLSVILALIPFKNSELYCE